MAFTISSSDRAESLPSSSFSEENKSSEKAENSLPLPSCSNAFRSSGWNTTTTAMIPTEMVLDKIHTNVFSFKSSATAQMIKIIIRPLNSTQARVRRIQSTTL